MTRLRRDEVEMYQGMARSQRMEFSIWDGMKAAAEDTVRVSAEAAVARALGDVLDQSDRISPQAANDEFGLTGTFAEIAPDEELTYDQARRKAEDYHRVRRNRIIQDTVNSDSPVLGMATQFAASLAAGMMSPTNIGIGFGVGALARSAAFASRVTSINPAMGKSLISLYDDAVRKSVTDIAIREGAENFLGALAEETVNFAGVGEDTLSRKVTAQESLFNVVAGTVLGGTIGTVVTADGRKAIGRLFGRKYGDDAADLLKAEFQLADLEEQMGAGRSGFEARLYDKDTFSAKPWHDQSYSYTPLEDVRGRTLYLPLDQDNRAHFVSQRGKGGTVLTDNINQAYNKGSRVMEVELDDLRLMNDKDFVELEQELSTNLMAPGRKYENIEELLDAVEEQAALKNMGIDPHEVLEDFLSKKGYQGYIFQGKKASGEAGYNGVYVMEDAARSLRKKNVMDSPVPDEYQKALWSVEMKKLHEAYAEWIDDVPNRIKQRDKAQNLPDTDDEVGKPRANDISKTLEATKKDADTIDEIKRDLQAAEEAGEAVDLDRKEALEFYEKAIEKDPEELAKEQFDQIMEYQLCMLGLIEGAVDG